MYDMFLNFLANMAVQTHLLTNEKLISEPSDFPTLLSLPGFTCEKISNVPKPEFRSFSGWTWSEISSAIIYGRMLNKPFG